MSKLYIALDQPLEVRQSWGAVAQRLGVETTPIASGATHAMPHNGITALAVCQMPGINFMPAETLAIITDRILIGMHLPALPAVAASSQAELEAAFGTGPVYLKPRDNVFKRMNAGTPGGDLCHTAWESPALVPTVAYTEMAEGRLVACPHLGSPHHNLEIDFAVNAAGDMLVMHCFNHGFQTGDQPLRMTLDGEAPPELIASLQLFCKLRGVRGGIHSVQAVNHNGQWVVMDWNPRPSGMYPGFAHLHPGIADRGLAHMMGLALPEQQPVYIELRPYWDRQIPNTSAAAIRAIGLHPRWVYDRSRIARVAAVANTRAEVDAMFNAFEETL